MGRTANITRNRSGYLFYGRTPVHRREWQARYGTVPRGHEVHHVDSDKTNNEIGNLLLLSASAHRRIHYGWQLTAEGWLKPCSHCRILKPLHEFPVNEKDNPARRHLCSPCRNKYERERSARRRAA